MLFSMIWAVREWNYWAVYGIQRLTGELNQAREQDCSRAGITVARSELIEWTWSLCSLLFPDIFPNHISILPVNKEGNVVQGCQPSASHEQGVWLLYHNKEVDLGFTKHFNLSYSWFEHKSTGLCCLSFQPYLFQRCNHRGIAAALKAGVGGFQITTLILRVHLGTWLTLEELGESFASHQSKRSAEVRLISAIYCSCFSPGVWGDYHHK